MKVLVTGHPRSGTGYASKCLQDIGLDVGHEKIGKNGISSWLWAANCHDNARWGDNYTDINPDITILVIRNPKDVIASTLFTCAQAYDWMDRFVNQNERSIMGACQYLLSWNKLALKNRKPDVIVKTESFDRFCLEYFGRLPSNDLIGYNTRNHDDLTDRQYEEVLHYSDQSYKLWEGAWG